MRLNAPLHRLYLWVSGKAISYQFTEFHTVRQQACSTFVSFDDDAVADYFDDQIDLGRAPAEFFRVWIHTHPGDSPTPSSVDEQTFDRVFGDCHHAIMFILARGGQTYARLRQGEQSWQLRVESPTTPADAWLEEYRRNVSVENDWHWLDSGAGDLFGSRIQAWSRDDARQTGELVDLSDWSDELFQWPVACTAAVWDRWLEPPEEMLDFGQSVDGRVHDLLRVLYAVIRTGDSVDQAVEFEVLFQQSPEQAHRVGLTAVSQLDGGDDALVISLSEEA